MSFNRTFSHEIPSRPRLFQMPVFKPGTRVMQGGREETVSRTFSKFVEDGMVEVKQRHVRIIDPDALQRLVNTSRENR